MLGDGIPFLSYRMKTKTKLTLLMITIFLILFIFSLQTSVKQLDEGNTYKKAQSFKLYGNKMNLYNEEDETIAFNKDSQKTKAEPKLSYNGDFANKRIDKKQQQKESQQRTLDNFRKVKSAFSTFITTTKHHTEEDRYVTKTDEPPNMKNSDPNKDTNSTTKIYISNHDYTHSQRCDTWCVRGTGQQPPYFLTAVLLVRIYTADPPQLSSRELLQWLVYLRYSGVEHIYVYDAYHNHSESQRQALKHFIKEGYVTYTDWAKFAKPYGIGKTQVSAYDHCRVTWGNHSIWQAAIDIDEYPFSPIDTKPGFLTRAIKTYMKGNPDVVEMTMQNFLFLGKPLNDTKHSWLADRILRRTPRPANALVKPIYKPQFVTNCNVHHNIVRGRSSNAPVDLLRLNHYWGARLQNWGEDTPEILKMTIPDISVRKIIQGLLNCEKLLRLYRLREQRWN